MLTDGAWGTELQKLGLGPGKIGDAWNLDHPEPVGRIARSYVEAGSQIILTNTFRANRIALANSGWAAKRSMRPRRNTWRRPLAMVRRLSRC